ncbi:MAG: tetratricopeptide repeat protein [Acidobacteriota bacterium]|nr:tetratricopeptide repeat protein [Acidobacteriota bacterium]
MLVRLAEEDSQYLGRAVAASAAALVRRGEIEQALAELDTLADSRDIYDTWWRTMGLIDIAGNEELPEKTRDLAARRALESTATIAGWKRVEALLALAPIFRQMGRTPQVQEVLDRALERVQGIPPTSPVRTRLMGRLARALGRAGRREEAIDLLERAHGLCARTMKVERPGILAALAAVNHDLGRRRQARALFIEALDAAAELVNGRPRALAAVAICGELGRHAIGADAEILARLQALRAGLKAPW